MGLEDLTLEAVDEDDIDSCYIGFRHKNDCLVATTKFDRYYSKQLASEVLEERKARVCPNSHRHTLAISVRSDTFGDLFLVCYGSPAIGGEGLPPCGLHLKLLGHLPFDRQEILFHLLLDDRTEKLRKEMRTVKICTDKQLRKATIAVCRYFADAQGHDILRKVCLQALASLHERADTQYYIMNDAYASFMTDKWGPDDVVVLHGEWPVHEALRRATEACQTIVAETKELIKVTKKK